VSRWSIGIASGMSRSRGRSNRFRRRIALFELAKLQFLIAAASAAALTETILHLKLVPTGGVNTTVLLPLKAGLAGVLAAALLSFWGFFWTEVLAPSTSPQDLPAEVRTYRRWFAWLVPALLLLFVSMGADFYLVLVNQNSLSAAAISFGTFGAAMFMIGLFVLIFASQTAVDMHDLLRAGQILQKSPEGPEDGKLTDDVREGAATKSSERRLDSSIAMEPASGETVWDVRAAPTHNIAILSVLLNTQVPMSPREIRQAIENAGREPPTQISSYINQLYKKGAIIRVAPGEYRPGLLNTDTRRFFPEGYMVGDLK
jgi:hypothetical protein